MSILIVLFGCLEPVSADAIRELNVEEEPASDVSDAESETGLVGDSGLEPDSDGPPMASWSDGDGVYALDVPLDFRCEYGIAGGFPVPVALNFDEFAIQFRQSLGEPDVLMLRHVESHPPPYGTAILDFPLVPSSDFSANLEESHVPPASACTLVGRGYHLYFESESRIEGTVELEFGDGCGDCPIGIHTFSMAASRR